MLIHYSWSQFDTNESDFEGNFDRSTYINFSETLRDKNKMFYYESLPSVNSIKTTWNDNSKVQIKDPVIGWSQQ
jgi:hypothetical protein